MARKKNKRHSQEEVELNLAAMLDMAFQLLAFFILTFRPSPVEGQLAVRLPPPVAVTNITAPATDTTSTETVIPIDESFMLSVFANDGGQVTSVKLGTGGDAFTGPADRHNLMLLDRRLKDVFSFQGTTYQQVIVMADPDLKYEELMKVIDVCLKQKFADGTPLTKLSFVPLPEGAGG